jgi:hypothetical protein
VSVSAIGVQVAAATDLVEMMGVRWWRLLAVPVAGLLLAAGCMGAGGDTPRAGDPPRLPTASAPTTDTSGQVLGAIFREDPASVRLARLDPRSLEPLPERHLDLPGPWHVLSVAPDRSMAVLGNEPSGKLAVVDPAGRRAYVHGDGGGYSVLDLGSNRVLRREPKDLPALLQPDQP